MLQSEEFSHDMQVVQNEVLKAIQIISKLMMKPEVSDAQLNELIDDLTGSMERGCVTTRTILEKYRPRLSLEQNSGKMRDYGEIVGTVKVTPEMWVHIRLNTLLPHCKYKTTNYLSDTIKRLLDSYSGTLPKYDKAFLAIVEYCNHSNRNAFDQDNKGWKQIPNALKGILFDDDDQFHLSLGLFSHYADKAECNIYVMPQESASDFLFSMNENYYLQGGDF